MNKPKQISGAHKPRTSFIRKVRLDGATRSLSMTKVIPDDWAIVRITQTKAKLNVVTVKIQKLLGVNDLTRVDKVNYASKQES